MSIATHTAELEADPTLSLASMLDPEVLADPYPLFRRLRTEDPVHWDAFLHAWVLTRYEDVVTVLHRFSANSAPTPERLEAMGASELSPVAKVLVKQMLFMDAPAHTRIRSLAAPAFRPDRVKALRHHIHAVTHRLIDSILEREDGKLDLLPDLAEPLPAIVMADMLGVPVEDHVFLKNWSATFAEVLGNLQNNPDRAAAMLEVTANMTDYFAAAIRELEKKPREGLVHSFMTAEVDGDRLREEEIIANCIITMVGGQETTTNLIGNGMVTLLRNRVEMGRLRTNPDLFPSAIEELLRYESPSQQTARLAPADVTLGGKQIRKGQALIAVLAAANRDPERFPEPDRVELARPDNRHVAFGWAAHYCFGAPLARVEGHEAFAAILARLPGLEMEPAPLVWRDNLRLRGLTSLPLTFDSNSARAIADDRGTK